MFNPFVRHIGCSFITSGYGRRDLDHLATCWVYLWNYPSFYLLVIHACYVHDRRVTQIDAIGHWFGPDHLIGDQWTIQAPLAPLSIKGLPNWLFFSPYSPLTSFAVLLNTFRRISNHLTHRLHISIFNFNIFIFKNLFVSPSLVLC